MRLRPQIYLKIGKKATPGDKIEITVDVKNNYDKDEIGIRISALSNSTNLHDKKHAYLVFGVHLNIVLGML